MQSLRPIFSVYNVGFGYFTTEYALIKELQALYGMDTEDLRYTYDGERLGEHPYVINLDGAQIGCMTVKKPRNTQNGWVQLAYFRIFEQQNELGSEILGNICGLADKYHVGIYLDAIPLDKSENSISKAKLSSLYSRYGFKGSHYMEREPNA